MLRTFLLLLLVTVFSNALSAQQKVTFTGKIRSAVGPAIPFASVFLKGTNSSTMANLDGSFRMHLKPGFYTFIVRYVGYRQMEESIELKGDLQRDFVLEPEVYRLRAVKISDEQANPANKIVRAVMAKRKELRAAPSYECDVYTKGVQKLIRTPKKIFGEDVKKALNLDSNKRGILYLSETRSKLYFQYPDIKEVMHASKVAGDNQGFSFNRAIDLQVNFYKNTLHWEALGSQYFVSPVASNAFHFYKYKLADSYNEKGMVINKIQVIPKRKYSPTFSGYIYVIEGEDKLYGVDLMLTEHSRINFVDTLHISQHYTKVGEKYWLPADIIISFKGKVLGFDFAGYFTALYSDYVPNPSFDSVRFNDEVLRIGKEVNQYNSDWWEQNRPVPLTDDEQKNYDSQEPSTLPREFSDEYNQMHQKPSNKFRLVKFLTVGQRFENPADNSFWYIYPLHKMLFYNTIEGWGLSLKARYLKDFGKRRLFEAQPNIRYGLASNIVNANAEFRLTLDTLKHTAFTIRGGSDFLDLNNKGTINLFYNTLTTLFQGRNYLKLYRSKFMSFAAQSELYEGLKISGGVEFARRYPLQNASNKGLFDKAHNNITSNNPINPGSESDPFPVNNSFSIETKLSYTFGQKYINRPDGKIYEPAHLPTLILNYRKAFPGVFDSAVDYDFISADLYQDKIRAGLWGFSAFYLSAGKFINSKALFFCDYHHFTGSQTAVYNPLFPNFHFLDFYSFATDDKYFEAHYEHNFSGKLVRSLPLLRKLKLEEIAGGAYLAQPNKSYREVYVGLQRLMFRVDFGMSWSPERPLYKAFRIFYGF